VASKTKGGPRAVSTAKKAILFPAIGQTEPAKSVGARRKGKRREAAKTRGIADQRKKKVAK
jgi:hypothetical protein